jgi:hypothetical protein
VTFSAGTRVVLVDLPEVLVRVVAVGTLGVAGKPPSWEGAGPLVVGMTGAVDESSDTFPRMTGSYFIRWDNGRRPSWIHRDFLRALDQ